MCIRDSDKVGMTGFEKRPVHTLSGGQKQRLTIACTLISNRNFILLDEPTAFLDQTSQLKVLKTIKNLTSDRKNLYQLCGLLIVMKN